MWTFTEYEYDQIILTERFKNEGVLTRFLREFLTPAEAAFLKLEGEIVIGAGVSYGLRYENVVVH